MADPFATPIVLHQFSFSHFNEKARWVLDHHGVAHRRKSLLPGFHARAMQKLTGGSEVPVLVAGSEVIAGSAAIVAAVDARAGGASLFPTDPDARARVDEWIAWLDADVGPAVRLALFAEVFPDAAFAGRMFATGQAGWKRALFARLFPRIRPQIERMMNITPETASAARDQVATALDRIAEGARPTGYLVGDRFGAADLSAAALCMPLYFPDEIPFQLPEVHSDAFDAWLARWRGHPAEAWVRGIWAKHRNTPARA